MRDDEVHLHIESAPAQIPKKRGGRPRTESKFALAAEKLHPGQMIRGLTMVQARGIWKACIARKKRVIIRSLGKGEVSIWCLESDTCT